MLEVEKSPQEGVQCSAGQDTTLIPSEWLEGKKNVTVLNGHWTVTLSPDEIGEFLIRRFRRTLECGYTFGSVTIFPEGSNEKALRYDESELAEIVYKKDE